MAILPCVSAAPDNLTSMEELTPYNLTTLSIEEIELRLGLTLDPVELNRVRAAYEFAGHTHEGKKRNDGTPYFFHCARVGRILLDELNITDPDLLAGALLHDVMEDDSNLTKEILSYNFGMYVSYIVETLTKNLNKHKTDPEAADTEHIEQLRHASEDCLIIRLAARLDNFRCLEYSLKRNPIIYVQNTIERYVPLAEQTHNEHLQYLVKMLHQEKNKFFG